jgi:hypothetical protein
MGNDAVFGADPERDAGNPASGFIGWRIENLQPGAEAEI